MALNDLYRKYFEHQAVNHPDLLHDPASGSRVFQMIDIEEAFGDFRQSVQEKGFIMRLIDYTYTIGLAEGESEPRKNIQGGFIIAKYYSQQMGGEAAYKQAKLDAERVMDDMIQKMISDSQAGHPLFHASLDSNQDIAVVPDDFSGDLTYSGYRCIFSFSNLFQDCINDDSPEWLDGGVTPEVL